MQAKVVDLPVNDAIEMGKIIDFEKERKAIESKQTISLSCNNEKSAFVTYFTSFIKRMIDIMAGIVGIMVLIPLTIVVFLVNKILKEDGPIFYKQERIGKNGKMFKMLKFRSMVVGAEEKLKKYLAENEEAREEYKTYKKLSHDPRVTKIGKFLRKTSLDEIPQLLHLLDGTMSLVGPRPYLPGEREDMGEYYGIIVKSKPGITGLWQVSGRSNATFDERLDLDIVYEKNKSLKQDFKIVMSTVRNVLKKEGAV